MAGYIIVRSTKTSYLEPEIHIKAASLAQAKRIAARYHAVAGYDLAIYPEGEPRTVHRLAIKYWYSCTNPAGSHWGKWEDFPGGLQ